MAFVLPVTVHPDDIDGFAHVNNVVYVKWIQDVAIAHSQAFGFGYPEYVARGQGFIVRRHEVDYLRAAVVGEELEVETRVTDLRAASCTRQTAIRRASTGELYARGITSWAYVDLGRGRPARIPQDLRSRFPLDPPFPWASTPRV